MNNARSYFIDIGFKDVREKMYLSFEFDKEGIPLYKYPHGKEYNITFICHYAIYNLYLYQTYKKNDSKEKFLNISQWLKKIAVEKNNSFNFHYNFPIEKFNLKPPWISAMAQGRVISVFTRAFELTNNDEYLYYAHKAANPFFIPFSEGGVLNYYPDGSFGLEEYPSNPPSFVLNGFIIALFGLLDIIITDPIEKEITLYEKLILSLEKNLTLYDTGYWSNYYLFDRPALASVDYHKYHILLLWKLYEMLSQMAKSLSSPERLIILNVLSQADRDVESLSEVLSLPHKNVSFHLQNLKGVGLVMSKKKGRHVLYSIKDSSVVTFFKNFRDFASEKLSELHLVLDNLKKKRYIYDNSSEEDLIKDVKDERTVLIDISPKKEYLSGHIPGALSIPEHKIKPFINNYKKDNTLIIYCRGLFCSFADKIVDYAREKGIKAFRLENGIVDWKAKGLTLETT